jgi:hypothetical protein
MAGRYREVNKDFVDDDPSSVKVDEAAYRVFLWKNTDPAGG